MATPASTQRKQSQPAPGAAEFRQLQPPTYQLERYTWRASLSITGPLLLFGFYAFICFYYLNRPPENDIITFTGADARAPFYAWFIISIFALDWARSGLANLQAAALMHPRWAPSSAMKLMWHADDNWANVLWWLRGVRNVVLGIPHDVFAKVRQSQHHAQPGVLWWLLSFTSFLLFVAIPLSGLTMELQVVSAPSDTAARILGPEPESFHMKADINLPEIVRGKWKTGGQSTPADSSIFYAPEGITNVSLTYYNGAVGASNPGPIQTFLGPAVEEIVAGSTWGIEASVDCRLVAANALKLIQVEGFGNYSWWNDYEDGHSLYGPMDTRILGGDGLPFPQIDETGRFYSKMAYSLAAAADGSWQGSSPYDNSSNWDESTLDRIINNAPPSQPTTGLLEAYLWQGTLSRVNDSTWQDAVTQSFDPTMATLRTLTAPYISTASVTYSNDAGYDEIYDLVGFGIQCHVKSAVGNATVSASTRTYSSFERGTPAAPGGDFALSGVQVQALEALGIYNASTLTSNILSSFTPSSPDSTWLAMHLALGLPAYVSNPQSLVSGFDLEEKYAYHALTPLNVTRAVYKLLGESMVGMMGPGSQDGWYGRLTTLEQTYWLQTGVMPWQPVLALLALWAVIVVGGSAWSLGTKRWAPKLDGFEMFRFGAQYKEEVNAFRAGRFEECEGLNEMPGMVGSLAGNLKGGKEGFIGLSNEVADASGHGWFVFERARAGTVVGGGQRRVKTL